MCFTAVVIAGLCKAPLQSIQGSHDTQQLVTKANMIPFYLQAASTLYAVLPPQTTPTEFNCDCLLAQHDANPLRMAIHHSIDRSWSTLQCLIFCKMRLYYYGRGMTSVTATQQNLQGDAYRLHPVLQKRLLTALQGASHVNCVRKPLSVLLQRTILHLQTGSYSR